MTASGMIREYRKPTASDNIAAMRHTLQIAAIWLAGLWLIAAPSHTAEFAPGSHINFKGTRGVNITNWFVWIPQKSPDSFYLPAFQNMADEPSSRELADLHKAGFDFVRLTVDPGVFMILTGQDLQQAVQTLHAGIDRLRAAGLAVVVDMHPVSRVHPPEAKGLGGVTALEPGAPDASIKALEHALAMLAGNLDKAYGGSGEVAFELLNEPDVACGSDAWRQQEIAMHRIVRAAAPHLTLVLTGSCWSNINGLLALKADDFDDPNTLFTFHFYDDHSFTHQGTLGNGPISAATTGLPYPWNARPHDSVIAEVQEHAASASSDVRKKVLADANTYLAAHWDQRKITAQFDRVADWALANHVPPDRILLGEFGVNQRIGHVMGAHEEDRLRWLTDVRTAAQTHGFRWAYWVYRGNPQPDVFDLADRDSRKPVPSTVKALGLAPVP